MKHKLISKFVVIVFVLSTIFPTNTFITITPPSKVEASTKSAKYNFPKLGSDSVKIEAYEQAPILNKLGVSLLNSAPNKIVEFNPPKYAFSINTKTLQDLEKITFIVTKPNDQKTELLVIEPGDNEAISLANPEYKYVSNLFTFEEGIKEIEFFGDTKFEINTIEFPDVKDSLQGLSTATLMAAQTPEEFYASTQVEKEYRKKIFQNMGINIITRDEWGADYSVDWDPDPGEFYAPEIYNVNRIIVHHTATGGGSNPKAEIKAIHDHHAYTNGWIDIGYNYIIDKYGNIYEGRSGGNGVKGAHAGAATNPGSIGIAMLGTYSTQLPTQAALQSLSKLMAAVSALNDFSLDWHANKTNFSTTSDYGVYGHRDAVATACPGGDLYEILPQIVATAKNYKTSTSLISLQNEISSLVDDQDYIKSPTSNSEVYTEVLVDTSEIPASLQEKFETKSRGVEEYYTSEDITIYKVQNDLVKAFIGESNLIDKELKAQPNYLYHTTDWNNTNPERSIPSDYNASIHWNLEKIKAPEAWKELGGCASDDTCGGSANIKIAVLDTGVSYENFSFDAGTDSSYTREKFAGHFIEYPATDTQDGVYTNGTNYEGYEREFDQVPEVSGVTYTDPYDAAWEWLCLLRANSGQVSKFCNTAETNKINHANDDNGHGTAVTSVIAANTGNLASPTTNRVAGIAHNVQIIPVKIFLPNDNSMCQTSLGAHDPNCSNDEYDNRSISTSYLIRKGIQHAIDNDADVINMSIGGGEGFDSQLEAKINEAYNAGITLIAASGNDGGAVNYPAAYANVISVGASRSNDTKASYSSYGNNLDLVAPVGNTNETGVAVQSFTCFVTEACSTETNQNLFINMTSSTSPIRVFGTSFSAPQVAAAAALIKSDFPTITNFQLKNLLLSTTSKIAPGESVQTGRGILNLDQALEKSTFIQASSNPNINPSPDGNSRTDLIAYNPNTSAINVTPSTGTNFGGGAGGSEVWTSRSAYGSSWNLLKPADVDGDGNADIIAFNKTTSQVNVTLSDGQEFGHGYGNTFVWNSKTFYGSTWKMLNPADVNGDGKADLIAFLPSTTQINVTLSDGLSFGGGFAGSQVWNSKTFYSTSSWRLLNPADVTGDGRADIIAFNSSTTAIDVTPSTGTNFGGGFGGAQIWNSKTNYGTNWKLLSPADATGDNRADIIAFNTSTTAINVTRSNGTNFGGGVGGSQVWNSKSGYSQPSWVILDPADVDGDGDNDIIAFYPATTQVDVTRSNGSNFGGGFKGYEIWNSKTNYNTSTWKLLNSSN